jgi:maleylacetate reductase
MDARQKDDAMSYFQSHFESTTTGVRVRFGTGVRNKIAEEIERLECRRALVLSTPQQTDAAMELMGAINGQTVCIFAKATMHTPSDVKSEALKHIEEVDADCVVAIGGGSTTGLGKAIALNTDLPQIVIPTTYAGSEATPILGQTKNGVKTTLSDPKVLPEVILYDAELVATLPVNMTVTSGLNAMAHAAEALYAQNRNPISTALAVEGLKAFVKALPRVVEDPSDLEARGETLYGAWLCGTVLGQVGMALHHKLCHTLGGTFDLQHAETHAVILPHAIAFNAQSAADELAPLTSLFEGENNAGTALYNFAKSLNAPLALADIGMREDGLDKAADFAIKNTYWNPRSFERSELRALLQNAFEGAQPETLYLSVRN